MRLCSCLKVCLLMQYLLGQKMKESSQALLISTIILIIQTNPQQNTSYTYQRQLYLPVDLDLLINLLLGVVNGRFFNYYIGPFDFIINFQKVNREISMYHNKVDPKKLNFNLSKFYEDLQRVQSSLGKTQNRKISNSPAYKENNQKLEEKTKALNAYKKELNRKELTKTRINLDMPYEKLKYTQKQMRNNEQVSEIRFSEHSSHMENDHYESIKSRLSYLARDQVKERNSHKKNTTDKVYFSSKALNQEDRSEKNYFNLEKTMETPFNEILQPEEVQQEIQQKLLQELTKKNNIYTRAQHNLKTEGGKSSKGFNVTMQLQQHFREHRMMQKIINEFKRICGLELQDLSEIHSFLAQGNGRSRVRQDESNSQEYF